MNRRTAFAVVALLALPQFAVAPALGAEPEIFTGLVPGTAVGGYDAVAYHTQGKPVQGSTEFTHQWKGAEWRFASQENLETFRADPEAYAPQFGGYCAYGVAKGYAVKGEPEVWKVVDGKLYLNYDARVQRSWESDIPATSPRPAPGGPTSSSSRINTPPIRCWRRGGNQIVWRACWTFRFAGPTPAGPRDGWPAVRAARGLPTSPWGPVGAVFVVLFMAVWPPCSPGSSWPGVVAVTPPLAPCGRDPLRGPGGHCITALLRAWPGLSSSSWSG
jgi:YHS domain-containing protein